MTFFVAYFVCNDISSQCVLFHRLCINKRLFVYISYIRFCGWIQSTSDISITMLPSAGIDWRTVDTIICRFFRNLCITRTPILFPCAYK